MDYDLNITLFLNPLETLNPNVCRLDHKLTGELILATGLNEDINVGYSVNKTASEYTLNNLFQFKLLLLSTLLWTVYVSIGHGCGK